MRGIVFLECRRVWYSRNGLLLFLRIKMVRTFTILKAAGALFLRSILRFVELQDR